MHPHTRDARLPRPASFLCLGAVLVATSGVAVGQGAEEQQRFWSEWQPAVVHDYPEDRLRLVREAPETALAVLRGIAKDWEARRAKSELSATELTPFLYDLAAAVAKVLGDEEAAALATAIGMAPRDFRDRFERGWRLRALRELRQLIRKHPLAAYGCVGAMIDAYHTRLEGGRTVEAAYHFEVIGPLALLVEEVLEDPEPREAAVPVPEGWKAPVLEPTFTPGVSRLSLAEGMLQDANAAEERGDLVAAINGFLLAARLLAELGEAPTELVARTRAARIAVAAGDWTLAAELLPPVRDLATTLGDEPTRLYAEAQLRRLADLRRSGEVEVTEAEWQREESFGAWKDVRLKVVELPGAPPSLVSALDPNPIFWRWVPIGGDGTARLPMPGKPKISRLGGDLWIDAKLNGRASQRIEGDPDQPVAIQLTQAGADNRDHALRFFTGQKLEHLGVEFDLGGRQLVFYRAAAAQRGKLRRTQLWLIDGNGNGEFDDFERDGLSFGKKAQTIGRLSRVITTGDRIYEIAPDPAGNELRYRRYEGTEGKVAVTAARGSVASCLLRPVGSAGVLLDVAVDEQVVVPAGRYVLDEALLVDRDGRRVTVRGGEMAPIEVTADSEVALVLGKGLTVELGCTTESLEGKDLLAVPGETVLVRGALGEVYEDARPQPLLPTVEVRVVGRDEDPQAHPMELNEDAADQLEVRFPRRLTIPLEAENVEVRALCDDPLLGPIAGEWRAVEVR